MFLLALCEIFLSSGLAPSERGTIRILVDIIVRERYDGFVSAAQPASCTAPYSPEERQGSVRRLPGLL